MAHGRLYRVEEGRLIFGVCGGVAEYFSMDPLVVRVIWAVLALWGPAAVLYAALALVLPRKSRISCR